jgi:hypothetical protein
MKKIIKNHFRIVQTYLFGKRNRTYTTEILKRFTEPIYIFFRDTTRGYDCNGSDEDFDRLLYFYGLMLFGNAFPEQRQHRQADSAN